MNLITLGTKASVIKNSEWLLEGSLFSNTKSLVPRVEVSKLYKKYRKLSKKYLNM